MKLLRLAADEKSYQRFHRRLAELSNRFSYRQRG